MIALLSFSLGVIFGLWLFFAYASWVFERPLTRDPEVDVDVAQLIDIVTEADIVAKRDALIQFIWGAKSLPYDLYPQMIEENIIDERYTHLENLQQINKITVEMVGGINSIAYHFIPVNSNKRLIIYHEGHDGDFISGIDTIETLLEADYTILGLAMPLQRMNNQPTVNSSSFGPIKMKKHSDLAYLDMEAGHPVQLFLQPVAVILNYLETFGYDQIYMMGLSGGGWTTVIYAAVDPRITRSYPVAGSWPIYLRLASPRDWGDYEETIPELYKTVSYLEMYILGSYGKGRKQLQVFNRFDSCCFAGEWHKTYAATITEKIMALGAGDFDVYLDETQTAHKISATVLDVILEDMSR